MEQTICKLFALLAKITEKFISEEFLKLDL